MTLSQNSKVDLFRTLVYLLNTATDFIIALLLLAWNAWSSLSPDHRDNPDNRNNTLPSETTLQKTQGQPGCVFLEDHVWWGSLAMLFIYLPAFITIPYIYWKVSQTKRHYLFWLTCLLRIPLWPVIISLNMLKCYWGCLDGNTCKVLPSTWLGLPDPDKTTGKAAWVPRLEMRLKFIHGFMQSPPQLILQLYMVCKGFWYPMLDNFETNIFFRAPIYIFVLSIGLNFYTILLSSIDYFYQDNDRIMNEPICQRVQRFLKIVPLYLPNIIFKIGCVVAMFSIKFNGISSEIRFCGLIFLCLWPTVAILIGCYLTSDYKFGFTSRFVDLVILNTFTIGLRPARMGTEDKETTSVNRKILRLTTWINFLVNSIPVGIAWVFGMLERNDFFKPEACKEWTEGNWQGTKTTDTTQTFNDLLLCLLVIGLLGCIVSEIYLHDLKLSKILNLQVSNNSIELFNELDASDEDPENFTMRRRVGMVI